MNNKIIFFLLLIFFKVSLYSQDGVISYIIPDIGTPGLNTYVEIIGPATRTMNFGPDLAYFDNQRGQLVFIELVNPADSTKVTISPFVVSWNGRMISVQFFVHPWVNPNSWDWQALRPEFKIPFRVFVSGRPGNIDTFYIVKPFQFGDKSGNRERVLGAGTLGKRSRRGAMIVDSMILANDTYTISKTDCDPFTNGNQGYLQFVLISLGKISGGNNTKIDGDGELRHAGPGGGGGGGRFCDAVFNTSLTGDDGGDGFTGGGPGGRNKSGPFGNNEFRNTGNGTSGGGASLNGVGPGTAEWYEASGGGTGHPFGVSGSGCNNGNMCDPEGGYGGGSGYQQNKVGGSGGFSTNGSNSSTKNGGKVHGNDMIVPIAGGSGGASGNPNRVDGCSGSGGGGGGALRFCGTRISGLEISANGGTPGSVGESDAGGGGSGGHTSAMAKLGLSYIRSRVNGQNGGGAGRIRLDAPSFNVINNAPPDASVFNGPTTDTSMWVERSFTLTGSKKSDRNIRVFLKPLYGAWTEISGLNYNNNLWDLAINLSKPDTIFFLTAFQDVENANSSQYLARPFFVLSQAAANILRVIKLPTIDGDSIVEITVPECPDNYAFDTVYLKNIGEGDLEVYFQNITYSKGDIGFELVSPLTKATVKPEDSVQIIVKYTFKYGRNDFEDTLFIPHNDYKTDKNPWRIYLKAKTLKIDLASFNILPHRRLLENNTDALFLDTVCLGSKTSKEFIIVNNGDIPFTLDRIEFSSSFFSYEQIGDSLVLPKDSSVMTIFFNANVSDTGQYWSEVTIRIKECPEKYDKFWAIVYVTKANIDIMSINDTFDFGEVCIGATKELLISIFNSSDFEIKLENPVISNQKIFSSIVNNPIVSNNDSTIINLLFKPNSEGTFLSEALFYTQDCAGDSVKIYLKGKGVKSKLQFYGNNDFGDVPVGKKDTIDVILKNNGSGVANINSIPQLSSQFKILKTIPPLPLNLKPNDSIIITIEFFPIREGRDSTLLQGLSDIMTECKDSTSIFIYGNGVKSKIQLSKYEIDFGLIKTCETKQDTIIITNKGTGPLVILSRANISGSDRIYFNIVIEPQTIPFTLNPNDSAKYVILFKPEGSPNGIKNAIFSLKTDDLTDSIITVPLKGENEKLIASLNPNPIDFGAIPIGQSQNRTITLTNNGRFDAHINNVVINNPDLTITPLNITILKNGGTQDFIVTFSIKVKGNQTARIKFLFDEPCPDSLFVDVFANGLEGSIEKTNQLNFGMLAPCEDSTMNYYIKNTGQTQVEILSIKIIGIDASLFSFTDIKSFPLLLDTNNSLLRTVLFSPLNTSDGIKQAQIIAKVVINADTVELITGLIGEKRSGLLLIPNILSFGNVVVGTSKDITLTIKNDGKQVVNIEKILPLLSSPIFLVIPDNINIALQPNESINLIIRFSPNVIQYYEDSLKFAIKIRTCYDTIAVWLNGYGTPAKSVLMKLPYLNELSTNLTDFKLPIYAFLPNNSDSLIGVNFRSEFSFNSTTFYPYKMTKGRIISSTEDVVSFIRTVEFQIDSVNITNSDSLIAEFICVAYLGNSDTTELQWNTNKFEWQPNNLVSNTQFENGLISFKICKEGGKRLLLPGNPITLIINPNPIKDYIITHINVLESGWHSLELFNTQGESYVLNKWYADINNSKEYSFEYNLSDFSNGIYYIRLLSPTQSIFQQVIIVK